MKYNFTKIKLWTTIEIIIVDNLKDKLDVDRDISILWDFVEEFENEFSRFIGHSSLSRLNKEKDLEVSDVFIDILQKSLNLYKFTSGYFNPLLNLKNIWYSHNFKDNNFEIIPEDIDLDLEDIVINWNRILLNANQNLDFWWIAKGYLVDLLVKKLEDLWYENFSVNAWGDIYLKWLNEENEKWVVWIQSPYVQWYIWTVSLSDTSISTSWSYKRHWQINGENYHHIINPYTLKNENSLIWITIISQKCYISDSLATAIFSMWMDKAKEFMTINWIDWMLFWSNRSVFLSTNFTEKNSFTNL